MMAILTEVYTILHIYSHTRNGKHYLVTLDKINLAQSVLDFMFPACLSCDESVLIYHPRHTFLHFIYSKMKNKNKRKTKVLNNSLIR